jgi:hypothetical protein
MNWNDCTSPIWMFLKMMASFGADNFKSDFLKGFNKAGAFNGWE